MAEKGVRASVLASSDVLYDWYCQQCSTEELHLEATSFCQQCQEYLCDSCSRYHRKFASFRQHKLLDKTSMPKDNITPKNIDTLTQTCPKHANKVLEYFCDTHNDICCSVCLTLNHVSCPNKSYVPDIAAGTANSQDYTYLVTEVHRLVDMAINENAKIDIDQHDNDTYKSKAIYNIKEGRKRVDSLLDKMVDDSVQKVSQLHLNNEQTLTTARTKSQTVLSDVQRMASGLRDKAKEKKNNQLFVDVKLSRSRVSTMEDEIRAVTKRNISRYVFEQDEKVEDMVSTLSAIFSLSVRQNNDDTKARFLRDISVKTDEDKENCKITGIAVLPGDRLVVTDSFNNAVKLVDVKMSKTTSRISLSSKPFDVTRTTSNQLAVTLGDERMIEIITVTDVLTRSHTIDVPGDPFQGLCYDGQHFILVYLHARVIKKVDMSGRVVSTVFTNSASDPLFQLPCYIALSRGQDVLYVADMDASTVTCFTLTGRVIAVYSHAMLCKAVGVAVGADDRVNVCSKNRTIHQLSASGRHVKVLLDEEHGLAPYPYAIAYSVDDDTLAISSGDAAPKNRNYIKLFKIEKVLK